MTVNFHKTFSSYLCRAAWEDLEDMPKTDAMEQFYALLSESAAAFIPWMTETIAENARRQAQERAQAEKERLEREAAERARKERLQKFEDDRKRLEQERQQQQQQSPLPPGKAAVSTPAPQSPTSTFSPPAPEPAQTGEDATTTPAAFMAALKDDANPDTCLTVGRGEVVRVRIPNPRPGVSTITWRFCTELHDIGFGLDYEVDKSASGGDSDGDKQSSAGAGDVPNVKSILPVTRVEAMGTVCACLDFGWVKYNDKLFSFALHTCSARSCISAVEFTEKTRSICCDAFYRSNKLIQVFLSVRARLDKPMSFSILRHESLDDCNEEFLTSTVAMFSFCFSECAECAVCL